MMDAVASLAIIALAIRNLIDFCQVKLNAEMWPNGPTGAQYKAGLVRIDTKGKNRGSFVEGLTTLDETISYLVQLDWAEITPPEKVTLPNCQYFRASASKMPNAAWTSAISLKHAHELELPIGIVNGDHGQEITAWVSPSDAPFEPTDDIHIIVEDGMLSTWYPGPLLPPTPEVINPDPDTWDPAWPVKISQIKP